MGKINLSEIFKDFKEGKDFDRPTTMKIVEDIFKTLLRKKYNTDENFDIKISGEKGDVEITRRRKIVADAEFVDENLEIKYSDAVKIEPDFEIGEEIYDELDSEEFNFRRSALTARQTLSSRINELKKNSVIQKYTDRIGEIINAEVYQIWKKEILLMDEEGNELILPKTDQIPKDFYKKGDSVRAVIDRIETKNGNPLIIISRTSNKFLAKLMELEVPEIFDGLITIKKIVRDPGERAKIVVETFDDRIDPVGACVGVKGSRIHGIVHELKNENIDIVNFTNNTQLLLQRSLSPAKITAIELDTEKKRALVYLKQDQVSLAIGKKGSNIKLASELLGYEIDVFRDEEEITNEFDIDLDEFNDEIELWIIDELKRVGCDTARSVLQLTAEELERRTDLEKETIEEIRSIFQAEFDKGE